MLWYDEDELVAYVADYSDCAAIVLREAPSHTAAVQAMRRAAGAVLQIPHPDEPDMPLPNECTVLVEDGEPVLHLDMQGHRGYAAEVVQRILAALPPVEGRLVPKRRPPLPFEYDANADIFGGADALGKLDERGLPAGFPQGFPVPEQAELVLAERARDDRWDHAAWRRSRPFGEYPDLLRAFGCTLATVPDPRSLASSIRRVQSSSDS